MPVVGALAAPELILAALLTVGLLYATRTVWVPFLIWMLSQIPVIGNWVASQAGRLINDAFNWMSAKANQVVTSLTEAIRRVVSRVWGFTLATASAIEAGERALVHLIATTLPALEARAGAFASTIGTAAQQYAHALVAGAQQLAAAWVQLAEAYARALYQQALNEIALVNVNLSHWVDQQLRALNAWVSATAASILNKNAQDLAQAEARARVAEKAVADQAAHASSEMAKYAKALTLDGETYARSLTADAERLAKLLNSDTLARALVATGAVAVSVTALEELSCIKLCAPLSLLGNAIEALDLAGLLLLIAEASTDPKGTADFVRSTVGPVVDVGAALYHDLGGA
jgi:hypothetical protein